MGPATASRYFDLPLAPPGLLTPPRPRLTRQPAPYLVRRGCGQDQGGADLLFRSVLGLATAIRGPPPPRVARSTPLGLPFPGLSELLRPALRLRMLACPAFLAAACGPKKSELGGLGRQAAPGAESSSGMF